MSSKLNCYLKCVISDDWNCCIFLTNSVPTTQYLVWCPFAFKTAHYQNRGSNLNKVCSKIDQKFTPFPNHFHFSRSLIFFTHINEFSINFHKMKKKINIYAPGIFFITYRHVFLTFIFIMVGPYYFPPKFQFFHCNFCKGLIWV